MKTTNPKEPKMNWYDLAVAIRAWLDASPFRTFAEADERFSLGKHASRKYCKIADAISAGLLGQTDVQRYSRTDAYNLARELNPPSVGIPRLPDKPIDAGDVIAAWLDEDPANRLKKDAAARWNLPDWQISNYLRVRDVPRHLREAVNSGEIDFRRAVVMARESGNASDYKRRRPRRARPTTPPPAEPTPEERIGELQKELSATRDTLAAFQKRAKAAEERAASLQDALDATRAELDAAHEELARERAAPPVGIHIHLDREALKGLVK